MRGWFVAAACALLGCSVDLDYTFDGFAVGGEGPAGGSGGGDTSTGAGARTSSVGPGPGPGSGGSGGGGTDGAGGSSNCGKDCLGGACIDGVCHPFVISNQTIGPERVAVDATHVYWSRNGGAGVCTAGVFRRRKDGFGSIQTVALTTRKTIDLAVTGDSVVWATGTPDVGIYRCPIGVQCDDCGGGLEPDAVTRDSFSNRVDTLFELDDRAYWSMGTVLRGCPLTGCPFFSNPLPPPVSEVMATDGTLAYWLYPNALYSCDLTADCIETTTVMSSVVSSAQLNGLVTFDTQIYWLSEDGIYRCSASGCATPTLVTAVTDGLAIAVDTDGVFFTAGGPSQSGFVYYCPHTGCAQATVLATVSRPHDRAIALDDEAVYWTEQQTQAVVKVAK